MIAPALQALEHHFSHHLIEYMTFLSALAIAGVCTMPAKIPATLQEWWTWMRDSLQTAVPAARNHNNPQQPGGPAQPQK